MSTNLSPSQRLSAPHSATPRKPLSCTSCRQRKIKCDRLSPCGPCIRSETQCILPTRRSRVSQATHDALDSRDTELLRRIKRLEEMLANKIDSESTAQSDKRSGEGVSPTVVTHPRTSGNQSASAQASVTVDNQYAAFVKQQGSSIRHLNSGFWSSLTQEFDGLRQLIEGSENNDEESDDVESQSTGTPGSLPNIVFPESDSGNHAAVHYPSEAQIALLFQFFFTNVDPVCKILHKPTADIYYSNMSSLVDSSTRRFKYPSLEAVTFAAFFAAVVSMSSQECATHLGEEKDHLCMLYKRQTERALQEADYMNTLELATLQAFTIYIVAQQAINKARSSWALISLAIRIAHGMGLHQDGDGRTFSAFEAEMRRRLWWQIITLDMRASMDRGSDPLLGENSFNTVMPCNLNDEDFGYDSDHPLKGSLGPTTMTLSLLSTDALITSLKISLSSPAIRKRNLTLREREALAKQYASRVETTYLADYNFADQRSRLLRMVGHYWNHQLWLILHYPLHRRMATQHVQTKFQGLHIAATFLDIDNSIEQHPSSAGFAWFFKSYVPWHAIAVMLAELCTQPQGELSDRAWKIIQSRFKDWNGRVAGIKKLMLWNLIKSLLRRARIARDYGQDVLQTKHPMPSFDLDSVMQDFDSPPNATIGEGLTEGNESVHPPSYDDYGLMDQITDQPLDFFTFADADATSASIIFPNGPNKFDNWDSFTFDVNSLGDMAPNPYST